MTAAEGAELPDIPGYTGVSRLGSGGFADVYRAKREHLGRWVAIKVFRVTLRDKEASRQFRNECDAVMRLDREPDVLVVHDAGILPDGRPYLVSELCDGSLQQLVARRAGLPPDEVTAIGHRIASALVAAHFARVLHGDVTPQNILIRPSGAPVLADFGLAVLRDHRGNTASGFNPAHAAPETVRHEGTLDERTDVYGLGSTLYTALTGSPPFARRLGEGDSARLQRILHEPPPRAGRAPEWLADLIASMLAKDPAERPPAGEVADALARGARPTAAEGSGPRYLAPPGVPPAPGSVVEGGPVVDAGAAVTRPSPASAGRSGRGPGRRVAVLLFAVAALVGVGTGAALLLGNTSEDPPAAADARIDLAPPEDSGTSVTLRWRADRTLDFGVVVAPEGGPTDVELAQRATSITVPVQPEVRYCFRVQGTDGRGAVYESNVQALRGAPCRFDP